MLGIFPLRNDVARLFILIWMHFCCRRRKRDNPFKGKPVVIGQTLVNQREVSDLQLRK